MSDRSASEDDTGSWDLMSECNDSGSWDQGTALLNAAVDGDEAAVLSPLGQGVHPDEWRSGYRETALYWAAGNGHTAVVRHLIEDGTALHQAANRGHTEIVRLLLNAGAEIAARCDSRSTPLHFATRGSDAATIETPLLWGADLDARDDDGDNPRNWAYSNAVAFDDAMAKARGLFWTRALHPQLPPLSREVVVTVLLCLWRVATTAAPGTALHRSRRRAHPIHLPVLPVELWEMVLGFARAVDLIPRRA